MEKEFLATHSKRILAYLIDIIPIVLLVVGVGYLFFGFDVTFSNYLHRGDNVLPREVFIKERNWMRELCLMIWVAYCAIMEASEKQGTWGKQLMQIKVVSASGNRLTFSQSVARNFSKMATYFIFAPLFIWGLFDKKRQCLHDKLHKTYVVKRDFGYIKDEEDDIIW